MSDSIKVTKDGTGSIGKPTVAVDASYLLCGVGGSARLWVTNQSDYTNATYQWFNDTGMIQQGASGVLYVSAGGNNTVTNYYVQVLTGGCSAVSDVSSIVTGNNTIPSAIITANTTTICGDTGVALLTLTNATYYTNATYQWYRNDTLIAGATDKIYLATEAGEYRIRVIEGSCTAYSDSITITKTATTINKPVTSLFPQTGIIYSGSYVEITVSNASQFSNPTYVWYKGTDSVGAGSSVYQARTAGVYFVLVQEGGCSAVSLPDTIRFADGVIAQPTVDSDPSSDTICGPQGSVVLTVTNTTDYFAPQYQWFKNNDSIIGANASVYVATDSGMYTVIVTDTGVNSAPSAGKQIYMVPGNVSNIPVPVLVSSSLSNTICGDTGSFILSVQNWSDYGSQTIYRWYKGTEVVQSTTIPNYVVRSAGIYWVYVIDGGCSAVSTNDTVTTSTTDITKPVIASLSGTKVCGPDGVITLSLTNAGSYTGATYTWYRNDTLLAGETNAILHVTEAGAYRIQVMEGTCTALSDTLVITKDNSSITVPNLVKSPVNATLCGDSSVVYLYVTNGIAYTSPVYRWFRNDTLIAGATAWYHDAVLAGVYKVEVDDNGCTSISNTDTVLSSGGNMNVRPQLRYLPTTAEICGDTGSVIITLTNSHLFAGSATYQWYRNGIAITTDGNDSIYIATEGGYYRIQVMEGTCSTLSDSVYITKNNSHLEKPILTSSSPNLALCSGGTILLTVNNSGDFVPNARYVWYKGTAIVQDGADFTYEVSSPDVYFVQVVMSGGCAAVSDKITITAGATIITPIAASVSGDTVLCGTNGSVMLELTNASIYGSSAQIQWYRDNTPLSGKTGIYCEATTAGLYKAHVLDVDCGAFSNVLHITYDSNASIRQPKLTNTSINNTICATGGSFLMRVDSAMQLYPSARFVWYKNDVKVQDSTLSEYVVTSAGIYYVQVIAGGCSSRSLSDTITEQTGSISKPVVTSIPASNVICNGNGRGRVILSLANATDYTSPTIQWYKNGVAIAGATAVIYEASDSGVYRVQVWEGSCTSLSDSTVITENNYELEPPIFMASSLDMVLCNGGSILFWINNSGDYGDSARYIWYNGTTIVQDSSIWTYEATTAGSYFVQVVTANGCSVLSGMRTITSGGSITPPAISREPNGNIICGDSGVVILRLDNVGNYTNPTIQWYRNNQPITGANTALYIASDINIGVYKVHVLDSPCGAFSPEIIVTKDSNSNIYVPTVVSSSPNLSLCTGGSILLSVSNTNRYSTAARYIWYKGAMPVQDSIISTYEVTAPGIYFVQVVDGTCSSASSRDTITQGDTIKVAHISSVPNSNTICGDTGIVMLMLDSIGNYTNPTVQWYRNNVPVVGATEFIYAASDTGVYRVQVMEGNCGTFSNEITVTKSAGNINVPIVVSSSPDMTLCTGGSILLSVDNAYRYSNTARYIWYNGATPVQDSLISTYEVTATGVYFVQVVDGSCSAISDRDTITQGGSSITSPVISSVPNSNTICGDSGIVMLRLDNVGIYTNPTLQWYRNNVLITGATDLIYAAHDTGVYRLQVMEGNCGAFSNEIVVTKSATQIYVPIVVSSSPDMTLCTGGSILLSVDNAYRYSNTARYIWYNGATQVQDSLISTYEATAAGIYFVQVVDGTCSSVSTKDTITSGGTGITVPQISSLSASNQICGDTGAVLLTLTNASSYTAPTIQWYKNNVKIPNATAQIYVARESGMYRIHVTDASCSAFSDTTIELSKDTNAAITKPILLSSAPSGHICDTTGKVLLAVSNASAYSPTAQYVWYRGDQKVQDSVLSAYETADAGTYFVYIIDGSCSTVSDSIVLTKSATTFTTPVIAFLPPSANICGDTGVVFLYLTNPTDYTNPSYQWYKGNTPIAGATNSYYSATDSGMYRLVVTEGNCSGLSNTVPVTKSATVINQPVIASYPSDGYIYAGNPVKLFLQNGMLFGSPQYYWYNQNRVLVSTDSVYSTNTAGQYTLLIVDGGCAAWSNELTLKDTTCSIPVFVVKNISTCDTLVDLSLTVVTLSANNIVKYYMDQDAQLPISGSIVSQQVNTTMSYYLQSVDTLTGCKSSVRTVSVTVVPALVVNPVPDLAYCQGSLVPQYAFSGGTNYDWRKLSGDSIGLPDSGSGNLPAFTAIVDTSNSALTAVYEVIVSNSACTVADTFSITVNPNPTVTAVVPDRVFCANDSVAEFDFITHFAAENNPAGTYYEWTHTNGGQTSSIGLPDISGRDTMPAFVTRNTTGQVIMENFTVTAVTGSCTSVPNTFIITVNPSLVINSVSDIYTCSETMIAPISIGGNVSSAVYTWERDPATDSIPGLANKGTGNIPPFMPTNMGSTPLVARYIISMSYTNAGITCTDTSSFWITVYPHVAIDAIQDITLCNGDSLAVNFTGVATQYRWTRISGNIPGLPISGTGDIHIGSVSNPTSSPLSATYKVNAEYVHALGACSAPEIYFDITVNPSMTLNSPSNAGVICSGSTFTYTAVSPVTGVTYSWTRIPDSLINAGATSSGQSASVNEVLVNSADTVVSVTYEFTLTLNGCTSLQRVTVDVAPLPNITLDYRHEVCYGATEILIPYVPIVLSSSMEYSITFTPEALDAGLRNIVLTKVDTGPSSIRIVLPNQLPAGSYVGTLRMQAGACSQEYPFSIRVLKPTRLTAQTPISYKDLCDGNSVIDLAVQADGDSLTYQWYHNGQAISGADTNFYRTDFVAGLEGDYYVVVTGKCGIVTSDTFKVTPSTLLIHLKWDNVLYIANPNTEYVGYQWYRNGVAVRSGGTSQYYTEENGFDGRYKVIVFFADGTRAESCEITLKTTKARKMLLFPNPVHQGTTYKITFEEEELDNASIEIYDVLGKLIEKHVVSGDYIELNAWYAPGSYVVKIVTEERGIRIKKLIVE
jgi:hypothetical protein